MKAAVICSKGIGDGLLMMTAAHRLKLEGYSVTTFQDSLHELSDYFPGHHFAKRASIESLDDYSLIILQNDNTPFSFDLIDRYRDKIYVFYASYEQEKHRPLTSNDTVFDRSSPMVKNIGKATAELLNLDHPLYENGLTPPEGLTFNKYPKRVVIHPTSTSFQKNWSGDKFIKLAQKLEENGWEPTFSVSPDERKEWKERLSSLFPLPYFSNLSALAAYLYESHFFIGNDSGTGHLASNLNLPTLIVAGSPKHMALWRPAFLLGEVVTTPSYIPNFKFFRLRDEKWQRFISTRRLFKTFKKKALA